MAVNDTNLFNAPGVQAVRELFHRRLGVNLNLDLVTLTVDAGNVTVTAKATAPDGTVAPYLGSVTYPLQRVSVAAQLPEVLVWSGTYPMTVSALATYLMDSYEYYLDDGEFFGIGDDAQTPLVRGGTVQAILDPVTHRFRLQATDQAVRWVPGSTLTFQVALSNSLVGEDGLIFIGTPPDGVVGKPYAFTYKTEGGREPVTYVVESGTPPGLLDPVTGRIAVGNLMVKSTYQWVVLATDADGMMSRQEASIQVNMPPLVFNPPDVNPAVAVGEPVAIDLGISGGNAPLTYVVYSGILPSTASITDGYLRGTFDGNLAAGQTALSLPLGIKVTDALGTSLSRMVTLLITDRSMSDITASLRAKVQHWYEAPAATLHDGDAWIDSTGRMDLTVHGTLNAVAGPGSANALSFVEGYAQANTTAYNLAQDFSLVAWVKKVNPTVGQVLMGRGAGLNGQYELRLNDQSAGWSLATTLSGATVTEAMATWPSAAPSGSWYQSDLLFFGDRPEQVINAGTVVAGDSPFTGTLVANYVNPFALGASATSPTAMDKRFTGHVATAAIFASRLWSDERKWLYKGGQVRTYSECQLTQLTGTFDNALVGVPYSSTLTISGGGGSYSNPRVTVGTLPAWAALSIVSGKLYLNGTPTGSATTINITVAVDGGDGQTATSAQSFAVSLNNTVMRLNGTTQYAIANGVLKPTGDYSIYVRFKPKTVPSSGYNTLVAASGSPANASPQLRIDPYGDLRALTYSGATIHGTGTAGRPTLSEWCGLMLMMSGSITLESISSKSNEWLTSGADPDWGDENFVIGAEKKVASSAAHFFSGDVLAVYIYDHRITTYPAGTSEFAQLEAGNDPTSIPGMLHGWRFNGPDDSGEVPNIVVGGPACALVGSPTFVNQSAAF